MLAQVQHQEVHLVVNPAKGTLRGWTIIRAACPEAGQTSLGLQTLEQDITSVTVNGLTAEYTLLPPPTPGLGEISSDTTVQHVAEHTYSDHLAAAQYELLLNLVIELPQGWDSMQPDQQHTADGGPTAAAPADGVATIKAEADGQADGVAPTTGRDAATAVHAGGQASASAAAAAASTQALANGGTGAVKQEPGTAEEPAGKPTTPSTAAAAAAAGADVKAEASAPPAPSLLIRIAFTAKVKATSSSAVMLLPGDDRCTSCEMPGPDGAGARYLVANTQRHRARALFPCADVPGYVATYDVHITVPPSHLAVCDGLLRNQVVSHVCLQDGTQVPHSRTFVFTSEKPVSISSVLLATGPMAAWPLLPGARMPATAAAAPPAGKGSKSQEARAAVQDNPLCTITCFGPPGMKAAVLYTCRPLHLILKVYEKHLACRFPFSQLYVVFVPAAAFRAQEPPVAVGSNIILLSTQLLIGPDACEPTIDSTLALAGAVARCIFGGLLHPFVAEDAWVLDGLAVHLSEVWIAQWLGKNELAWRRHKERQALAQADNGGAPPLCSRTLLRAGIQGAAPATAAKGPRLPVTLPGNRLLQEMQAHGSPFGTELLEPGRLRCWKAAAVIRMFELRAGRDEFKRTLGHIVHKAISNANVHRFRHIATEAFLKAMHRASGIKGIEAFAQRWIYGRGCPDFEVGFVYNKNHALDIAVRQGGNAATRRTALLAARAAKTSGAEDDAQTQIKIVVHELEAQTEVVLKVSAQDTLLLKAGVELQTKMAGKRPGVRKGKAQQQEAIKEEEGEDAVGTRQPPVWLRFDPHGEWLCRAKVYQPDACWVAQLDKSRDVAAQSMAVAGLANLAAARPALVAPALSSCLRASNVYCRVRAEAALALGLVVGAEVAQPVLCSYLHDALYDPGTLSLKPNNFGDLSEHEVLRALPVAIGLMRGEGSDKSPVEAIDALLGFLENCDNTGNPYSDAWYVARFVEGLGHTQPVNAHQLRRVVSALDRQLALEDLRPSPHYAVGDACLTALCRLACQLTDAEVLEEVKQLLQHFASKDAPLQLRHSAARNLMQMESTTASTAKGDVLLKCLLELVSLGGWGAAGQAALFADAFAIMGEVLADDPVPEKDEDRKREVQDDWRVSVPQLLQLYHLMHNTRDARTRQYIFMLVQRMAQQDPTLYREREEEKVDAIAAAAQPEVTVRSGGAAPTAPAVTGALPAASGGTTGVTVAGGAGTAAAAQAAGGTKIKLKLTAAHSLAMTGGTAPTTSQGTVGPTISGLAVSQSMPATRSSLHTIPEGDNKQEGGQPGQAHLDDEVLQPVRAGGYTPATVKAEASSGTAAVGPQPTSSTGTVARDALLADTAVMGAPRSPPRDPRARMPTAASVQGTPAESVGGHSMRSHAAAGTPPSVAMSRLARTTISPVTSAGGTAAAAALEAAGGQAEGAGKQPAAADEITASPAPLRSRLSFERLQQAAPETQHKVDERGDQKGDQKGPGPTSKLARGVSKPTAVTAAEQAGAAAAGHKPTADAPSATAASEGQAAAPAATPAAAATATAGTPPAAKPPSRKFGDSKYRRSVSGATGGAGSSGGAESKSVSPPDVSSAGTAAAAAAMAARGEHATPSHTAPGQLGAGAAGARPPRQPTAPGQHGVKAAQPAAGMDVPAGAAQQAAAGMRGAAGIGASGAAADGAISKGIKRLRSSASPTPPHPSPNTPAETAAEPITKMPFKLKVRPTGAQVQAGTVSALPAQGPPAGAPSVTQAPDAAGIINQPIPSATGAQPAAAASSAQGGPAPASGPLRFRVKFGSKSGGGGGGAALQQPVTAAADQPSQAAHAQWDHSQQQQQQQQPSYPAQPQPAASAGVPPLAPRVSSGGGAGPAAGGGTKLKISVKGFKAAAGAPSPTSDAAALQPQPKKPRQQ